MKSFMLIFDNGNAMIVSTNPDFAMTELCSTSGILQEEINRLRSELDAIASDANGKFEEYARNPRSGLP